MDRESTLTLLEHNHTFPGPFDFRVVVRPDSVSAALAAMRATVTPEENLVDVRERESRNGKYISLRVRMHINSPEHVLDIYEVLHALHGVVTTM